VLVVSSGETGLREAMACLRDGGTPVDAVEAGIRIVESDPRDHSVGYSGYPNILGKVELDACIMDGTSRRAGAVAALGWCPHAISVARRVMEELPHVLLVGEGADRFAKEMGFPQGELISPEIEALWKSKLLAMAPETAPEALGATPSLRELVRIAANPEEPQETVDFIARDDRGNIASGVSTSGWAWKYPGRVGDSPIIGAGNYADSRHGAAACTGRGEMAIRGCTARSVVLFLLMGMSIQEACKTALDDLAELPDPYFGWVDIVAVDARGEPYGVSWEPGHELFYITDSMSAAKSLQKTRLPLSPSRPGWADR
jgi:beta-aspartyl-peptidase (threonine type)